MMMFTKHAKREFVLPSNSMCRPEADFTHSLYDLAIAKEVQYDGSNDDLDWRIDFRYLHCIFIIIYLRSSLIKGCSIE